MKIKHMDWLILYLAPRLGVLWLRFLGWSMRLEYVGVDGLKKTMAENKSIIFALWHGRQLTLPVLYPKLHQGRKLSILISQHKDGEYISRIIKYFGMDSVRGSTYRGAIKALKQLVRLLKTTTTDIGITPDGPRGPKYQAQLGIILLAKLSGAPIVPLTYNASKKKLFQAGMR